MKRKILGQKFFPMDLQKRYVKKFRIYPSFLYHYLDVWLKRMSLRGLHIVHCGWFFFYFEEGTPQSKEYFTYGMSTQEGKYSISLRYPSLEKTYGLEKKKSKINSNEAKAYQVVEIDSDRIDIKNDAGYREMVQDRNRLYLEYFIRNTSIFLIVLAVLVVLLCY